MSIAAPSTRPSSPDRGGPGLAQELRLVTAIPGPRSIELFARRHAAVARGVSTVLPVFVRAAGGGVIVDVDGNSLIDFGSGIAVVSVGNAADEVVDAVTAQVAAFTHTCFMVTPYEGYVAVCEALNRLTPGDHDKRSALFNSGAEAVENAVKIARVATGRSAVVVLDHGYHGRTNLTMALTAKNMPYKQGFGPFAPEVYRVPTSYPFRWPSGRERCGPEAAAEVIDHITKNIGVENTACLVAEPIQGEGGFIVPGEGFLPALAEFCRAHGIVFVADEIQTGFARTGAWFACEHEGVVPDLITTAKGIAGGLPLAAVTGRADLMDAAHVGGLGGTYGNPVACRLLWPPSAPSPTSTWWRPPAALGDTMLGRLRSWQERDPASATCGPGCDGGGRTGRPSTIEPDPARTVAIARACHAEGVVVLTAGTYGNVLRLLPPLVMPEHLLGQGLDVLEAAFASHP
ncbi:MAG: 4-aminobutyrate--2-oxoglutarate transaminase [Acidimicrobiales bacterium]